MKVLKFTKLTWAMGTALTFLSLDVIAQDFSYGSVTVEDATFTGGNLPIRRDEGASFYGTPHWVADEVVQLPVAYVSGNAPRVNVNFNFECSNAPDSIWVRGIGPEGFNFQPRKIALEADGGDFHSFYYPSTYADLEFEADEAKFFKPFKIGWDVSFDEGDSWRAADTTRNTMYVTRSSPMAEAGHFKLYHSVYDISCRNADGESSDEDVIAAIWTEFTDHIVYNYKGDSLHYYSPKNTSNTNLGALLNFRNAQCYTFAQLFLACIKIQGVVRTNNYVYITPEYSTACGYSVNRFLVKNWDFGTPTGDGCAEYPYENTYTTLLPYPYLAYNFIIEDVSDQEGLPGQCSTNPSSYFNNHQISLIDGVYYDACYGVTFDNLEDIPFDAFDGWGYRYNGGGVTHARFTNEMGATELSQSITTF
ncbi:MAG: hypothetical protein ACI8ZM_003264 [Crocinitomix sp.]|jgi:hypothetical protein